MWTLLSQTVGASSSALNPQALRSEITHTAQLPPQETLNITQEGPTRSTWLFLYIGWDLY